MKLKKVHVTEFQSILDSNEFDVDDITCLVGKNEAGKTALLQALYRLNPIIERESVYSVIDDYPRWDVADYEIAVKEGTQKHAIVARAVFQLEREDVAEVLSVFGEEALPGKTSTLELSKGYEGILYYDFEVNIPAALQHLVEQRQFAPNVGSELKTCDTLEKTVKVLSAAEQTGDVTELLTFANEIKAAGGFLAYIFRKILSPRIPKFFYFDEYYQMVGRANIELLKQRVAQNQLQRSDYPLLGLINLARLDLDQLLNPSRTRELKNNLEGAGNYLTKRVVKYWSQNRYLQLRFDVRPGRPNDPAQELRSGTNIWGDVYDSKHMVTTELGTRSRGFVWFFSFLAWYADVQRQKQRVILLLDEPGLSLHAKAQGDLLRYFEAEIMGSHQLIYTTHSPFMVDPEPLRSRSDRPGLKHRARGKRRRRTASGKARNQGPERCS